MLSAYFTVIIPMSSKPTPWHPTSADFAPIGRGCFKTEALAHAWAADHLDGQPYTLQHTPALDENA